MSELLPPGVDVPMEASGGAGGGHGHGSPEEASSEAERKVVELINAATVAANTSGLASIAIFIYSFSFVLFCNSLCWSCPAKIFSIDLGDKS